MKSRNRIATAVTLAVIVACSAGSALAQQVYVANSSNGRISVFDLSGASEPFSGDTKSLVTPLGIALDGSGALIVADNQRDRILRFEANGAGPSVLAAHIASPDGPTFDQSGDLFFVSSPSGDKKDRSVYVIPGGTGPFHLIATIAQSAGLRETAVVPTGPYAGSLLVLSESPGFIARFAPDGSGGWSRESDFVAALPGSGTGMDFTVAGDLLVSGIDGIIWRYDNTGNRLADFASGLGVGPTRLAIGADGTVYVTNRNGPSVIRFDASGARLADFAGSLQSPAGVAVQSLSPTPVGTNVRVEPLPGLAVTFDQVVQAGFTTAERSGFISNEDRITPCGNVIPTFMTVPAGDPGFQVVHLLTTAGITDSIVVEQDHPDGESRLFHAACPPDAQGFTDVTTLAIPGDPRGWVPQFSEFVVARDARLTGDVIGIKLGRLQADVSSDSAADTYVDPNVLSVLRDSVAQITTLVTGDNEADAISQLQDFEAYVRQQSGTGIPNSASSMGGNIAGILESHAETLIFSLSLFLPQ